MGVVVVVVVGVIVVVVVVVVVIIIIRCILNDYMIQQNRKHVVRVFLRVKWDLAYLEHNWN